MQLVGIITFDIQDLRALIGLHAQLIGASDVQEFSQHRQTSEVQYHTSTTS